MKQQIVFSIVILTLLFLNLGYSQTDENPMEKKSEDKLFKLNWKINESDTVLYETIMTEIGESKFEMDFEGMFKNLSQR